MKLSTVCLQFVCLYFTAKPQEPDEPDYERILDLGNPVFKEKRASSKIIIVMEKLAMLKNKQKGKKFQILTKN